MFISLKYRLFFSLIFLFFDSFSQEKYTYGLEHTTHFGSILPHRPLVNEVIEGHSLISEISFFKNTKGTKQWQQIFGYPRIGFSTMVLDLGNPEELGSSYGIFPFIQFPLNKRKIQWNLRFGYGIGYIEKSFDKETNFKNLVIGSKWNALISFNSLWNVALSKRMSTSAGVSLVHFSNGSFARPNLGINIFSVNWGIAYHFGEQKKQVPSEIPPRERVWTKLIFANFGLKEIPPVEGPKYPVYTGSFNLLKPFSRKSSYGFAVDLFYNSSLEERIQFNTGELTNNKDNIRVGVGGIYSLDVGNVSYMIQLGAYLHTQNKKQGYIYNRFTTRYYIKEKLFVNLGLKTHYAVAEFIELGIGYRFKTKEK